MTATKEDFVATLAAITDEDERKKFLREIQLLAVNAAPAAAFEPPIRTAREYLASVIEVPPIIVGSEKYPIVVRGGLNATIGRAGKGKTVMALNRMVRWSAGLPMFDDWTSQEGEHYLAPSQPLRVLVIENEGAGGLFHKQLGIMMHADKYLPPDAREVALDNFLVWGDGGYSGLKLDEPEKLNWVRKGCEIHKPDLLFVEPFRGLWNGEENSATDMTKVVDALVEIAADYQCAVQISHHERKSGRGEDGDGMSSARGSSVLEGVVTVMENFESVQAGDFRELSWSKNRHGRSPNPCRMEWDSDAWWYRYIPDSDVADAILTALQTNSDEPMSVNELIETTGENESKVRKTLKEMVTNNRLKTSASSSNGRGSTGVRYRIPMDDRQGGLPV